MRDGTDRTLFITGGSRGIGAAVVVEAARTGWNVAFTYAAREEAAREMAEVAHATALEAGCRNGVGQVRYWRLDVRDAAAVDDVADQVLDAFGGVRAVICNAGINLNGLAYAVQDEDWQTVIDTNLTGTFHVCRAFLPELVAARRGRILVMSSITAGGASGQIAYASSKAGLQGLAQTLAKEYGPKGITTNVVVPGYFETDMTRGEAMAESLKAFALQYCPLRRLGELDELARTILFLASDGAGFINGAVIPVTGGLDWAP
ncbi:MAG: SDR family oxidoreductase [Gemmatimonadetes bacterium]|nr:SDR family oxidoreductase [Gemmatimonadota bacterium]